DVVGEKRQSTRACSLGGREVQRVERANLERLGEIAGAVAGSRVELDDEHSRPVCAEGTSRTRALGTLQEAAQVAEYLDPRQAGGHPGGIRQHQLLAGGALVLFDVALEERAGVDVDAHSPRSSASACSMRIPARARRTRVGGGTRPLGAEIQPWLMPSS